MRTAANWRAVATHHNDTLQKLAFRELQSAGRWPEIAILNGLRPPYLSGDPLHPGIIAGQVLLYGEPIKIPAPITNTLSGVTPIQAFGIDLGLTDGLLTADTTGDLALASGIPNLKQALELRLRNEIGCLQFHPRYGNAAGRLKGRKQNGNIHLLMLRFCEETLLADPRVKGVSDGTATASGDAVLISITALADGGTVLKLQLEI
jgi:hypothetical protein